MSYALQGNGQLDLAIEAAERYGAYCDHPFPKYGATGWIYGLAGRPQDALRMLSHLEATAKRAYASPHWFAWIYAGLGDNETWAATMQASLQERSGALRFLRCTPFDQMRSHPFYAELVRRSACRRSNEGPRPAPPWPSAGAS